MVYLYDLTLGLPHTNHRFLSEHLLLKYAGHFQWLSIAAAAGTPLSRLRAADGGEVYASFYFIEERVPERAALESFRLDDKVRFAVSLRASKNIAIEGRLVFDRPERLVEGSRLEELLMEGPAQTDFPSIRFANIFISPTQGNSRLRVAPPAGADFSQLPPLPNEENPYHLTQAAAESGMLGLLDSQWLALGSYEHSYPIDVDRDTNGAGLVYFANYVAFMDTAERLALGAAVDGGISAEAAAGRSLRHRRIAYYGNADVSDTLTVRVKIMRKPSQPDLVGFHYAIERREDGQRICLSEAIKALPHEPGP
jgi:probable biosynthetic protein (TIGR04098 family)